MPQQTKTIRVFISSTFTDMKLERSLLQKHVFPKLEEFCLQNHAKFQAVDLRWGVTEETQRNQITLQTCLNEVAHCQRISPKPNFLILLGDKYGLKLRNKKDVAKKNLPLHQALGTDTR